MFFPPAPNPSPQIMNWNIVVYASAIIFSYIYYRFRGRYSYKGPVEYIRKDLRSEEHTSELQSQSNLVCRLLLEKKKNPPAMRQERWNLSRGSRGLQQSGTRLVAV